MLASMVVALCCMAVSVARAETYELSDGKNLSGDVVSFNESGLVVRQPDGTYADRVPWSKFAQSALQKLSQNPKIAPLVEPFVEVSPADRVKRTEVKLNYPERLARPEVHSLVGAMFSSGVGWFIILLLYAATIVAGYEVAILRARPKALVCGLAAIPFIGLLSPIIFLWAPTRTEQPKPTPTEAEAASAQVFSVPDAPAPVAEAEPGPQGGLRLSAASGHGASAIPATQTFQRGAFTFNRRFFETKFPGFFGVIRRDAEKDMVLLVKAARGQYVAQRITRIAAGDVHLQVQSGPASQEVMIPFTEIQEIQLKHKDA